MKDEPTDADLLRILAEAMALQARRELAGNTRVVTWAPRGN